MDKQGFFASAPCKAILFGEHYVVYGSPALAIPIEPRNSVGFSSGAGGGIALRSSLGEGKISTDGKYAGVPELAIFSAVAKEIFSGGAIPSCSAEFLPGWKLKGVGTSASLCAAFAAGCFALAGKKAGAEGIFAAAQAGDLLAHGGRASGIDAKTVSYGKPLVFQRSFDPPAFNSEQANFVLPAGTSIILINTEKGKRDGTGKMLEIFAGEFGISTTPAEAPKEKRAKVREEFAPLWEKIAAAMKGVSARELGKLMGENHALLAKRNVSSAGIESAVSAALSAGAYGAKLTGGGGEGGAVLALCERKNQDAVARSISSSTGFSCHPITLAKKGAYAD